MEHKGLEEALTEWLKARDEDHRVRKRFVVTHAMDANVGVRLLDARGLKEIQEAEARVRESTEHLRRLIEASATTHHADQPTVV